MFPTSSLGNYRCAAPGPTQFGLGTFRYIALTISTARLPGVDPDGDVHINDEFRVHPDRMLDRERRRSLPTAARTSSALGRMPLTDIAIAGRAAPARLAKPSTMACSRRSARRRSALRSLVSVASKSLLLLAFGRLVAAPPPAQSASKRLLTSWLCPPCRRPRRWTTRRRTPPAAPRPARWSSSASCLPSAFPEVCVCG